MPESEPKYGIPFREFLEKSTNLLTVFGILNALYIFSLQVKDSGAFQFLGMALFVMSMLVWYEVIRLSLESSNGKLIYEAFHLLALLITIGLIYLLVESFKLQLTILIMGCLFLGLILGFALLINRLTKKFVDKTKHPRLIGFLFFLIAIILGSLLFRAAAPIIRPAVTSVLPDSIFLDKKFK